MIHLTAVLDLRTGRCRSSHQPLIRLWSLTQSTLPHSQLLRSFVFGIHTCCRIPTSQRYRTRSIRHSTFTHADMCTHILTRACTRVSYYEQVPSDLPYLSTYTYSTIVRSRSLTHLSAWLYAPPAITSFQLMSEILESAQVCSVYRSHRAYLYYLPILLRSRQLRSRLFNVADGRDR